MLNEFTPQTTIVFSKNTNKLESAKIAIKLPEDLTPPVDFKNFAVWIGLAIAYTPVSNNPNMDSEYPMNHYHCILSVKDSNGQRKMPVFYSMGLGLKHSPMVSELLECLALDASSASEDFSDFCDSFGYDKTRRARKIYNACCKSANQLLYLLGSQELYNHLLYNVQG